MEDPETLAQTSGQQSAAQAASRGECPPLAGYEWESKLGQGSFGQVWSARQQSTGQRVAVKLFTGLDLRHMQRELDRLRELKDHPAVVGLIDANLEANPGYLIMPLLARSLVEVRPTLQQALEWLRQICEGLSYTHSKGLLHCDLKPSNIMLDDSGNARLVDFGQCSQHGSRLPSWGTLGFMAPEQATEQPGVSSDVYGLAATFYFLLTHHLPYWSLDDLARLQTQTQTQTLALQGYAEHIRRTRLIPACQLNPQVDSDLSDLLQACLNPEPSGRPSGMALVLEDLQRRQQRLPLLCRRPWTPAYRLGKLLRRPAVVVSGLLLLGLLCTAAFSYYRIQRDYRVEREILGDLAIQKGSDSATRGHDERARQWWLEALSLKPDEDNLRLLLNPDSLGLVDLRDHCQEIRFSPDGKSKVLRLADQLVLSWSGQAERVLPLTAVQMAFHPRQSVLAALCQDSQAKFSLQLLDDVGHTKIVKTWEEDARLDELALAWNAEEHLVVLVANQLSVFDGKGEPIRRTPLFRKNGAIASLSPRGRWLASPGSVQDLSQKRPAISLPPSAFGRFSADEQYFVSETPTGLNGVWELKTGRRILTQEIVCDGWAFCGSEALILQRGREAQWIPLAGAFFSAESFQHPQRVLQSCASADGEFLLCRLADGALWLWSVKEHRVLCRKEAAMTRTAGFAGPYFYACDPGLRLWQLQPPRPVRAVEFDAPILGLAGARAGEWMAVVQEAWLQTLDRQGRQLGKLAWHGGGTIELQADTGLIRQSQHNWLLAGLPERPQSIALPEGQVCLSTRGQCASLSQDRVHLLNSTGQEVNSWSCVQPEALEFSQDGSQLAVLQGGAAPQLVVYSLANGASICQASVAAPARSQRPLLALPGEKWAYFSQTQVSLFDASGKLQKQADFRLRPGSEAKITSNYLSFLDERGVQVLSLDRLTPVHPGSLPAETGEGFASLQVHPAEKILLTLGRSALEPDPSWLWDLQRGLPLLSLPPAQTACWNGSELWLAQGDRLEQWDITSSPASLAELNRYWQHHDGFRLDLRNGRLIPLTQAQWQNL